MHRVLIHGLGQDVTSWSQVKSYLNGGESYYCVDLYGSVNGKPCTYENLYARFSNLMNHLDGDLDLCGLSLGGILALHYALDYPDHVRSLILINTQYKMPKTLLRIQNILFRILPASIVLGQGVCGADLLKLTNSMMNLNFTDRLCHIQCPTLTVGAQKDRLIRKHPKNWPWL